MNSTKTLPRLKKELSDFAAAHAPPVLEPVEAGPLEPMAARLDESLGRLAGARGGVETAKARAATERDKADAAKARLAGLADKVREGDVVACEQAHVLRADIQALEGRVHAALEALAGAEAEADLAARAAGGEADLLAREAAAVKAAWLEAWARRLEGLLVRVLAGLYDEARRQNPYTASLPYKFGMALEDAVKHGTPPRQA